MPTTRRVNQGTVYQGVDESIIYRYDFSNWGTPTSGSITVYDLTLGVDVTNRVAYGSVYLTGNYVDTPAISGLSASSRYRMTCRVSIPPNIESAYVDITPE
jgi:hypothetical protein